MEIVLLTIMHFSKFAFCKYTITSQHLKFSFQLTVQITVSCDVVSCNLVYSTPTACYYIQDANILHSFYWFILEDKFAVFILTKWQTVPYLMQSVSDLSLQRAWSSPRPVHVRFVGEKVALWQVFSSTFACPISIITGAPCLRKKGKRGILK